MATKFIRVRELASTPNRPGRLPVSPATIWRWVTDGSFPQPVKLSPGVTAFVLADVEDWEARRAGQEAR